mmetsp:Transcript_10856/g.19859  ORF Transcript_10856/g.19859 Transcript_10856/m.19859 type:complete len:264 (-) Transcript_10856:105-896(-)
MVDVNGVNALRADGFFEQSSAHSRVDAATDEHQHVVFVADLLSDLGDGFFFSRSRSEISLETGHVNQEVLEHRNAVFRQVDLRVELNTIDLPLSILDGGADSARRGRDGAETVSDGGNAVTVGQQNGALGAKSCKESCGFIDIDSKLAVFAGSLLLDLSSVNVVDELHAVADTENGHSDREHIRVILGCFVSVHALWSTRDDDGCVSSLFNLGGRHVEWLDDRFDAQLSHLPVDYLRVLGAGIEDQHALVLVRIFVVDVGHLY